MISNIPLQKGLEFVKKATEHDKEKRWKEANFLYDLSIEQFHQALAVETDESLKLVIEQKISEYKKRNKLVKSWIPPEPSIPTPSVPISSITPKKPESSKEVKKQDFDSKLTGSPQLPATPKADPTPKSERDLEMEKAIGLAEKAIKEDMEGNYRTATYFYETTLEHFLKLLQGETNANTRKVIQSKMNEYLARAEQLKDILEGKEPSKKGGSTEPGHVGGNTEKSPGRETGRGSPVRLTSSPITEHHTSPILAKLGQSGSPLGGGGGGAKGSSSLDLKDVTERLHCIQPFVGSHSEGSTINPSSIFNLPVNPARAGTPGPGRTVTSDGFYVIQAALNDYEQGKVLAKQGFEWADKGMSFQAVPMFRAAIEYFHKATTLELDEDSNMQISERVNACMMGLAEAQTRQVEAMASGDPFGGGGDDDWYEKDEGEGDERLSPALAKHTLRKWAKESKRGIKLTGKKSFMPGRSGSGRRKRNDTEDEDPFE